MGEKKFGTREKLTRSEFRAYLGFCIMMSINHLPALEDYWRLHPTFHYLPIADRITRDRFFVITRYVHFVDNTTQVPRGRPGYNCLSKVKPVLE
jgi:hypothetical protein